MLDGQPGPVELATARDARLPSGAPSTADGQALRSQTGLGDHRQPALADAGHGPAVRRRRRQAGGASSTGWCSRSTRPTPPGSPPSSASLARALAPAARRPAGSRLAGRDRAAHRRGRRSPWRPRGASWCRDLEAELDAATLPFPRPRLASAARSRLARHPAGAGGRAAAGGDPGAEQGGRRRDRRGRGRAAPQRSCGHRRAAGEPARCSTGRQKAFLISIVLAEAALRRGRHGDLPILLLDEVTAHLDPPPPALLAALVELGAQSWLTGTEPACSRRSPVGRTLPCRERSADAP